MKSSLWKGLLNARWTGIYLAVMICAAMPASAADQTSQAPLPTDYTATNTQFVPMTRSERFSDYLRSITDLQGVLRAAAAGGIRQAEGSPKEWGGGAQGYGERVGNAFAEHGIRKTLEYGSAAFLHEDNRYFSSGERGFFRRTSYAIASAFLARRDNGDRTFSFSRIGSAAGSAFISRAWQPRSTTTAGDGAVSFGITMAIDAGFNVLREFWSVSKLHF